MIACWLCDEKVADRGRLKRHLAAKPHCRLSVVCVWCDQAEEVFSRVYDLRHHVEKVHTEVQVSGDLFREAPGFYFCLWPHDYARVARVEDCNDDYARQARALVSQWVRLSNVSSRTESEWEAGWKAAEAGPRPKRPKLQTTSTDALDKSPESVRTPLRTLPRPFPARTQGLSEDRTNDIFETMCGSLEGPNQYLPITSPVTPAQMPDQVATPDVLLRDELALMVQFGGMPLYPPGRRQWQGEEVLEIPGSTIKWPPAGWQQWPPQQLSNAFEFLAFQLEFASGVSCLPKDELWDKYVFLSLPGTPEPVRTSAQQARWATQLGMVHAFASDTVNGTLLTMWRFARTMRDISTDELVGLINKLDIALLV